MLVGRNLHTCLINTKMLGTLPIVLCILALSFENNIIAFSHPIDDVTLKLIKGTMPILFPPSRISLHLCTNYDNTITLSRKLSNLHLTHGISNNAIPKFDRRIYNDLEHQNLYVLDLDCDNAIEILQQVNLNRMFVAPMRWLLLQDQRMLIDNNDDANLTSACNNSILEIFEDFAVYPDSDVVFAKKLDDNIFQLSSVYRPSPQRGAIWEERGNWTVENGLGMKTFDVASARRRNLQRTNLKVVFVILNPDSINHLGSYKYKNIDPTTKINYIWVNNLINRMNATMTLSYENDWGVKYENGSWDGMTSVLHKHEVDIGGTGMFIFEDRHSLVKYTHLDTPMSLGFVFRQPLLSSMKNIFTLPFERNVWIAIAIFLLLIFCSLYLSMKWEYHRNLIKKSSASWKKTNIGDPTIGDDLLVLLGAVGQQGYSYEPYRISARIITLMLLIASLSLYAAYTANIVALLQSPSNSIKTLSDLLHSPLSLGVEDLVYSRYMAKSFQDPVRKEILAKKIEPKGQTPNWMTLKEGVNRIRKENFAFHSLESKIYKFMQNSYQEEEKCGLTSIDYMNVNPPHLPLPKQSPYFEIIQNGAMTLREYGLKQRELRRFFTEKPTCSNQIGFLSIGFIECHFVMVLMGYGVLLSLVVFALELVWYKIHNKNKTEETVPIAIEKKDLEVVEYID